MVSNPNLAICLIVLFIVFLIYIGYIILGSYSTDAEVKYGGLLIIYLAIYFVVVYLIPARYIIFALLIFWAVILLTYYLVKIYYPVDEEMAKHSLKLDFKLDIDPDDCEASSDEDFE